MTFNLKIVLKGQFSIKTYYNVDYLLRIMFCFTGLLYRRRYSVLTVLNWSICRSVTCILLSYAQIRTFAV